MSTSQDRKGPWVHRFSIRLFTVVFTILIFWLLGFLVEDIESIQGPNYNAVEATYVDSKLVAQAETVAAQLAENRDDLAQKQEEMQIASNSSQNLQGTINQLIELQRLSIQKSITLPEIEQKNLSDSLSHFLDSQKQYQLYNAELSQLTDKKRQLETQQQRLETHIRQQKQPAEEKYQELLAAHSLYLAFLHMLILIPLLIIGVVLFVKQRSSIYFPFILGYSIAVLLKVSIVIHEYFPARYVKYVLIFALIIAVTKILSYFIRMAAFPKPTWLAQQYREAYEAFLCPVCEYPIRTGPRKFLFWTRRTVNKVVLPNEAGVDIPYTCPACGAVLFEICPQCEGIRHALLPYCQHCTIEKTI